MTEEGETYYTAPNDSRFPSANKSRHCYQNFIDYHRCIKKRGPDFEACKFYERTYKIMCPNFWIERWEEQMEKNIFKGNIEVKPDEES